VHVDVDRHRVQELEPVGGYSGLLGDLAGRRTGQVGVARDRLAGGRDRRDALAFLTGLSG
jgi:hypothetical protein